MPQDAYTLKVLCGELNGLTAGGRVNKIISPGEDQTVLFINNKKETVKLFISVNPARPRIGITGIETTALLTAPNFCMLMRKYLSGAKINSISLCGFDRIVKIDFTSGGEFTSDKGIALFVELMGRYSNIILTQNGKVLGTNRGNNFDNGVRPLIVGKEYRFPPDNGKLLYTDREVANRFNQCEKEKSVSLFITENLQGFSLSTAKEIEKIYLENSETDIKTVTETRGELLQKTITEFVENPRVLPCVSLGLKSDVYVYPYSEVQGEYKTFPSLLFAEQFYFDEKNVSSEFNLLKGRIDSVLYSAKKKTEKKLNMLLSREREAGGLEQNRVFGELIISNIYKIKKGDKSLSADNYYDGTKVEIPLNETLSPQQNAESYYKKYNKQKRTLLALVSQKSAMRRELEYIESCIAFTNTAKTKSDLKPIFSELVSSGYIKKQQPKSAKSEIKRYRTYYLDGFKIVSGRSNVENEELLKIAKAGDIWLHAKDYHSSHVFIFTEGKSAPSSVIITASEICAFYSAGGGGGKIEVVYTDRKNVKKIHGGNKGEVSYTDFKSVSVVSDPHENLQKDK